MIHPSYAPATHAEKRSLAAILRTYGPLPVMDAIDVTLDVCDELANAHMNNVVHGDLGVHRVRTHWPRHPGQPVDIFALGETDTAAFEVRISAGSILVAPEQKDGRVVDARADIFSVGVMLHWLITGAPPGLAPLSVSLRNVPRPVVATIEACLAHDPAHRPFSIDDVAEALGSFAASPPDRFAQIARRRIAQANAKIVRKDYDELSVALRRLDEAAISREVSAATEIPGPQETLVMFSVQSLAAARRRAQTDRYAPQPHPDANETWGSAAETLARPSAPWQAPPQGYYPDYPAAHVAPPFSVAPEFLSPDAVVEDYEPSAPQPRARVASVPPLSYDTPQTLLPPKRSVWSSVFGFVGTALVVAVAVGGAAHLSARVSHEREQTTRTHAARRPTAPKAMPSAPPIVPSTAESAAPVVTPSSLPAATSEPPLATPSNLPNAKPARPTAPRSSATPRTKAAPRSTPTGASSHDVPPVREASPASGHEGGAEKAEKAPEKAPEKDFSLTPSVLSDALR